MSKIKTRETVKNVKTIDKAAIAGERMKNTFIRSKNSTENLMDDRQITPSEYAEDKVMYAAEDISRDAAHLAGSGVRTAANKGKEAFQRHRAEKAAEDLRQHSSGTQPQAPTPSNCGQPPREHTLPRQNSRSAHRRFGVTMGAGHRTWYSTIRHSPILSREGISRFLWKAALP